MKRNRKEQQFLEQMQTIPNISLACEKVGLSRNTIYRWCKEDPAFKDRLDEAIETGRRAKGAFCPD
jgi:predicted DNA-binding transcriptional regulator AlpA